MDICCKNDIEKMGIFMSILNGRLDCAVEVF